MDTPSPPFPWQVRLAESVIASGRWPDVLDLPTGSGKTSVLDIALYALALRPDVFPRRIVMVIDRRVVVDQGKDHADDLLRAMHASAEPVVTEVAARLRALFGAKSGKDPFLAQVLRGGMVREDDWVRRPDQPVVAVSTVDQVGSRLLFSGYGVSDRMAPVHAGLLGNDTLFLLDEVHLSVPFAETLVAIHRRWRRTSADLPDRFGVVRMSATPGPVSDAEQVFRLDATDEEDEHLGRRLRARKIAILKTVPAVGNEAKRREKVATTAVKEALAFVRDGARLVAIVVNRIDTARVARVLLDEHGDVETCLLTGRMRPLDRDREVAKVADRLRNRIARDDGDPPLIVVATQCIEAGADFDFDALVTECASLDALRQRFGRLDRRGDLGESRAVVLARKDQVGKEADDPVYGPSLSRTFEWLATLGKEIDFGIRGLVLPETSELEKLLSPVAHAPVLLPAHLDAFSATDPRAQAVAEISLWLHGPERRAPEVQVVWRADLDLENAIPDAVAVRRLLVACPPGSLEAMTLPLYAVRAWLSGGSTDVADVPVGEMDVEEARESRNAPFVRWCGEETEIHRDPRAIRPGDTIVVPASYGGIGTRHRNFDPESSDPVDDLGDLVQWQQRGKATLRLHPEVLRADGFSPEVAGKAPRPPDSDDPDRDPAAEIAAWLDAARSDARHPWDDILREFPKAVRRIELPGPFWALVGPWGRGEVSTEDDGASFAERETTLAQHREDVRIFARRFTDALRLPASLAGDVDLAAALHDLGKADPRFQRMLVGGSEVRLAMLSEPLAKSAGPFRDARAREQARRRSEYPKGYRHELLSLALAASDDRILLRANDRDLVLHLVASHHGWCRPFARACDDPADVPVEVEAESILLRARTRHRLARLDSGVADRYHRLVDRYGWWGLAWLEAVLRLADHRASEAERNGEEVTG